MIAFLEQSSVSASQRGPAVSRDLVPLRQRKSNDPDRTLDRETKKNTSPVSASVQQIGFTREQRAGHRYDSIASSRRRSRHPDTPG